MRSRFPAVICLSYGVLLGGPNVFAADAPPPPTTAAASRPASPATNQGPLRVTIVEVKGNVQFRPTDKDPWQTAKVGAVLGEGAEFRTMPKSSVRCNIGNDQSFTLDRLGVVKVAEAARRGNKIKTDLMMKYGRTKTSVEAAGEEHESTISSPGGSLAVGGTVFGLFDQPPFTPEAVSYTGQVEFRDAHRQVELGSKGGKKAVLRTDHDSAADTAVAATVTDPIYFNARTASENRAIATGLLNGTIETQPTFGNITIVRNKPPILNDVALAQSLPPTGLSFVLRWFGNADLNLEVLHSSGDPLTLLGSGKSLTADEFLYPGKGVNAVPSGGRITYDNRGGPKGGMEVASWNAAAPHGIYGLGVIFISGVPVNLELNAFLNGKKQIVETIDSKGNLLDQVDYTATIGAGSPPIAALVYIPSLFPAGAAPAKATAAAAPKPAVVAPSGAALAHRPAR